ncbi:MAG: agmatinase [Chloroflexi bacterium]|nr:agmatinase [Chloroflexota bacterium]
MSETSWPTVPRTFLALDPDEHSLERARVVLLPVPYDATTSYRSGARDGPAAIIEASRQMEDYDTELECEPSSIGIYTAAELEPHAGGPKAMTARVHQAVAWYAGQDKLVGMLGGEHSLTAGAVRAVVERTDDVSVLVFDAQADLREAYQGTRSSHASAVRRIADHAPVTLVGVRSMTVGEAALAQARGIPLFPRGPEPITDVDSIVEGLSANVYVSFDLDAFDPSFMAAVGTPEPGGLGWWEALAILRAVGERRRIVGFDVVELSPAEGPEACAYTAAKLVYKVIAYATRDLA